MKTILFTTLFLVSQIGLSIDNSNFNKVLDNYVDSNASVSYSSLAQDVQSNASHPLTIYVQDLQAVTSATFNSWNRNDQMAFLINAYNALTLKLVVDNYPLRSIRDIGSPWDKNFFSLLGGQITSLNGVEHTWLRPKYQDYRIHAAVNCASISCPALRGEAFSGARLDVQLNEQMAVWVNDSSKNSFSSSSASVSKIFDWYGSDFVNWGGGINEVLLRYANTDIQGFIRGANRLRFASYNWNLNGN